MQADGHHLGHTVLGPLRVQDVEGISNVGQEAVGIAETRPSNMELEVVAIVAIRQHEEALRGRCGTLHRQVTPVRHIIRICVTVRCQSQHAFSSLQWQRNFSCA